GRSQRGRADHPGMRSLADDLQLRTTIEELARQQDRGLLQVSAGSAPHWAARCRPHAHAGHLLRIRPWSLRAVVVAPAALARPWLLGLPQAVPSWIALKAPRIGDLFGADTIELAILVVHLA